MIKGLLCGSKLYAVAVNLGRDLEMMHGHKMWRGQISLIFQESRSHFFVLLHISLKIRFIS